MHLPFYGRVWVMVVACVVGAACAFGTPHLSLNVFSWSSSPAYACGLGLGATMLANRDAALAFPGTQAGTPLGVFAHDYAVGQEITFNEDLSRYPTVLDPTLYQWHWDFGDGASASGFQV